jgi:hypothetical protein
MQDDEVTTSCSKSVWRRIVYKAPNGTDYSFLTNDFSVSPGVVAFLYLRRWDEEKCFDTWKNISHAIKYGLEFFTEFISRRCLR